MSEQDAERSEGLSADDLRVVRMGHGANCSSIGSVVDTLFATATLAAAALAAIVAALRTEDVTVVGSPRAPRESPAPEPPS